MSGYIVEFTGTTDWVALSATRLGFKGSLGCPASNGGNLQIRIGTAAGTTYVPGEYWPFEVIDLATVQIKGNGFVLKANGVINTGW